MYTGRRRIRPLQRPRPGTASRGKGFPYSIKATVCVRRQGNMPLLDAGQDLQGPVLADNFIVFHVVGFAGVLVADLGTVL